MVGSFWQRIALTSALFGLVTCAGGVAAFAQTTTPDASQSPIVTYPTNMAVSQPLWAGPPASDTLDSDEPTQGSLHPLPQKHGSAGQENAADRALQTKAGTRLSPQIQPAFGGIVQDGSIPPDPNIAVGPSHIVQLVNSSIAVFDKSGNMFSGYPKKLSSLWSSLGGGCGTNNAGDPVIQYDAAADRWLITQLGSLKNPYAECFAVSKSGDPTGAYNVYSYSFGTNLNDYPKFGVWPTASNSAYFGTYNLFANGSTFTGSALCAYDREAMISGASSPASVCFNISGDGGFLPADLDGATAPSDGSPGYFLNFETLSSLRLYKLTPDFTTPGNSTLSSATDLAVAPFNMACSGGTCVPQPGTKRKLDSLGDRLMYRLAYRNFGDHEAMVVNHSVTAGSGVGVRWYELNATSPGNFSVAQQGTFAPDSSYRWMGSIAMDGQGNMALGYSRSSGSVYPGVYLTGRMAGDPLNTMGTETTLQAGGGSQTGYTRWGDYTSMRIDPHDDCTFWYTNEYYPVSASYNWYTFIGSFKFPGCGSTATADFGISESPSPMTIAAGSSSSGTVTVTSLNGFNAAVNLSASCTAPVSCSLSPSSVTPPADSSVTSVLQVSVDTGATAGSYTSTITGSDGGSLQHSTTFTVNVPAPTSDFGISVSSPSLTISRGSTSSDTINLTGSGSISLSISGLPPAVTAGFSPNPATAPVSSTLTIKVNKGAKVGTYALTVTGNNGTSSHTAAISLVIH